MPQEVAVEVASAVVAVALVAVVAVAAVVVAVSEVSNIKLKNLKEQLTYHCFVIGGYNMGPPERLAVVAEVTHDCEGVIVGMVKGNAVPLLARMIWTENKQLIGKVEDVFGPKHAPGIAVTPDTNTGVKAESFKTGDKVS